MKLIFKLLCTILINNGVFKTLSTYNRVSPAIQNSIHIHRDMTNVMHFATPMLMSWIVLRQTVDNKISIRWFCTARVTFYIEFIANHNFWTYFITVDLYQLKTFYCVFHIQHDATAISILKQCATLLTLTSQTIPLHHSQFGTHVEVRVKKAKVNNALYCCDCSRYCMFTSIYPSIRKVSRNVNSVMLSGC